MKNKNTYSNIVRFLIPESNNSKAVNSDYTIANSSEKVYNLLKNDNYGLKVQSELLKAYQEIASTKEDDHMDWQEKYIDKLDQNINEMKQGLRDTENRIAQMVNQTLSEMRDRDNQRHQEFLELNHKIDYFSNSIDQKIDNVSNFIDQKLGDVHKEVKEDRKWITGMAISVIVSTIATIIGVATMIISILSVLHK